MRLSIVITSLLLYHGQGKEAASIRSIMDDLAQVIVSTASSDQSNETIKSTWINRIEACAKKTNITLVWKTTVFNVRNKKNRTIDVK